MVSAQHNALTITYIPSLPVKVKMGVPLAAVKLKMAAEGVACSAAATDDELPPKYARMVSVLLLR